MKKVYLLVLNRYLLATGCLPGVAGDYVATGSMEWNDGTLSLSDCAGGYTGTTTTVPASSKNVWVLSGATVTVTTTAAVCNKHAGH